MSFTHGRDARLSDLSIGEIALRAGFRSHETLARVPPHPWAHPRRLSQGKRHKALSFDGGRIYEFDGEWVEADCVSWTLITTAMRLIMPLR